jgi:hypothetical protein
LENFSRQNSAKFSLNFGKEDSIFSINISQRKPGKDSSLVFAEKGQGVHDALWSLRRSLKQATEFVAASLFSFGKRVAFCQAGDN